MTKLYSISISFNVDQFTSSSFLFSTTSNVLVNDGEEYIYIVEKKEKRERERGREENYIYIQKCLLVIELMYSTERLLLIEKRETNEYYEFRKLISTKVILTEYYFKRMIKFI
jgi:hypothetical protein